MNWPLIDSANLLNPHCVKSVQIRRFFWSIFPDVWTEYRKIRPRKNSVFGHFSRYVWCPLKGHIFSGPISLIVNSCFKDARKMINTVNSARILDIVNLLFHSRVMLRAAANDLQKMWEVFRLTMLLNEMKMSLWLFSSVIQTLRVSAQ